MRARTAAQDAYIRALKRHALVFGTGPAGTGKTWLAVAHAVQLFERKEVDRIILSRPAVEAGERLGFLPGDMREKVDPYLRPIYDALYDLMDARIVERALQAGEIEIAPLAFMRGRTLANAAVILDEAQNTTSMQMKMFLTRLGENSRMIVTGDPSQVDLPRGQTSGLAEAVRLLDGCRRHRPRHLHARGRHPPRTGGAHRRRLRPRAAKGKPDERIARRARGSAGDRHQGAVAAVGRGTGRGRTVRRAIDAAARPLSTRTASSASCSPTMRRSARSIATGARSTSRPTCCRFRPRRPRTARRTALGDIVIAYETLARESAAEHKPFLHHLAHLAVHGFLHLIGYDHETDPEAEAMERWSARSSRASTSPIPTARMSRAMPDRYA